MSSLFGPSVFETASGQWKAILMTLGVPEASFKKTGGPCPVCGGKDRWSFMPGNNPNGVSNCRQCGEGRTGFNLVRDMTGWDFATAAKEIESICGKAGRTAPVPQPEPEDDKAAQERQRAAKNRLWQASRQVVKGDPVDAYLTGRGVDQAGYSADLRFCPSAWYARGRRLQAMVAMVRDANGKPVNLHRTFLSNGKRLDAQDARRPMEGGVPPGSAIRLSPPDISLGIAEGIETAFAASDRFGLPVWSAMNAGRLAAWTPPPGTEEVAIFPDHDINGVGQGAAEKLAERLRGMGLVVSTHLPPRPDTDWADYVNEGASA